MTALVVAVAERRMQAERRVAVRCLSVDGSVYTVEYRSGYDRRLGASR